MKVLGLGLGLTAAVSGLMALGWGTAALVPGVVFGLVATAIQIIAVALVRPVFAGETGRLLKRWGLGMLLRLVGVALLAVAVSLDRNLFPPLPSAFALLGVLVPLLFLEVRLVR